jgi:hypothetical protein
MYEEFDVVDPEVAFSRHLLGKECQLCRRVLRYTFFDRDSTTRDGRSLICPKCKATPRLSAAENFSRQREANFSSVASQRRENEEDYMDRDAVGRVLHSSIFVQRLKDAGVSVICGPAHFADEISLYIDDSLGAKPPLYIGWIPVGPIQEFSEYEYNEYAVPTDEITHGYRGILRNLILGKFLTESTCNKVFGSCSEAVWAKTMWDFRNRKLA